MVQNQQGVAYSNLCNRLTLDVNRVTMLCYFFLKTTDLGLSHAH